MPTHEETERFSNEYKRLRADKRALFNQARKEWVAALFRYGPEQKPGEVHIIWERIGGHDIYEKR